MSGLNLQRDGTSHAPVLTVHSNKVSLLPAYFTETSICFLANAPSDYAQFGVFRFYTGHLPTVKVLEYSSYGADPGPRGNKYERRSDTVYPAVSTYLPYLYGLDKGVCILVLDMLRISMQDTTAYCVPLVGMIVTNILYDRQSDTKYPAASTCASQAVQDVTVDCVPVPVQDMTVDCVPYIGTVLGNVSFVCGSVLYTQSKNISDELTRISDG